MLDVMTAADATALEGGSLIAPQPDPSQPRKRKYPTVQYTIRPSIFSSHDDFGVSKPVRCTHEKSNARPGPEPSKSPKYSDFSGFYVALWLMLASMVMQPLIKRWSDGNPVLELKLVRLSMTRLEELAVAEIVLNSVTFSCLWLQLGVLKWQISWNPYGRIAQSGFEIGLLMSSVTWLLYIDWPWPHSIFFILHTVVHLMKIHSYCFYNGYLSGIYQQLQRLPLNDPSSVRDNLRFELTSPLGNVRYPSNLTIGNTVDWLLVPSVCYELEYPRVPRIRPSVLVSRILGLITTIAIFYLQVELYVFPVISYAQSANSKAHSRASTVGVILSATLQLMFPIVTSCFLAFIIIWEQVLNISAEITRFGDRLFYTDYWNAVNQADFARMWNVPVHNFLWRHVYSPFRHATNSKTHAMRLTFFVSALVHELVACVAVRKLKAWLFTLQLAQLGMIVVQMMDRVRDNRLFGKIFVWTSLIFGLSLNLAIYLVT
ncbi:MBOAT, membrane-bound O-acyltransferase family-domain-containing protein [Lipomyces orientalis]|uniref:MBOAT, membrane-bound O-acyltransferase family-domain-containing protein n=1 Tax=Lipomyces orientalis TaxID=1233043 RepID=A0ACC3TZL8_9ASCO